MGFSPLSCLVAWLLFGFSGAAGFSGFVLVVLSVLSGLALALLLVFPAVTGSLPETPSVFFSAVASVEKYE